MTPFSPQLLEKTDVVMTSFHSSIIAVRSIFFQVVTQFPALKCFYFHKNILTDMNEVQKLAPLKQLKYLTLHGNPIEITVPFLRSYVLCVLPGLRSLNCTPVTKGDRKTSEVWGGMNRDLLPKRHFFSEEEKRSISVLLSPN